MPKPPTLKAVREAHNKYADMCARWGEDNQATWRALNAYWELRAAYEAAGKKYVA